MHNYLHNYFEVVVMHLKRSASAAFSSYCITTSILYL